MKITRMRTVAAAALLGLVGASVPMAAHAALDTEALENAAAPEMADIALGVSAVLESMNADADAEAIIAALHAYLTSSDANEDVIEGGLRIVMAGEWSDPQREALRSIFSRYLPDDVVAPSGGADARADRDQVAPASARTSLSALPVSLEPPSGGASMPDVTDEEDEDETQHAENEPPNLEPPPFDFDGGGSDYSE